MLMPTWAPLVLRSQRVRGVTGRSLKPQRGGDGGAGVLPRAQGELQAPGTLFWARPHRALGRRTVCSRSSAASWLRVKYRFCHFLTG